MQYTLHQLSVFLKVTQTLSITKAAQELFLTQPAVSIQLKNFQAQFDVPLTEVIGRQIFITDFGREIASAAERILSEVEAIQYKTMAYRGLLTGRLTLSVVSTGKYVMPYFLANFMQAHPGIELNMDVTNKLRVLESLEQNEVDFALVSILPDHLPLEKMPLIANQLVWVRKTQQDQPVQASTESELTTSALIFREEGSGTRSMMQGFLDANNLSFTKRLELSSNEAVKQAVMAGLGISLMPMIGIKEEIRHRQLEILPVAGTPLTTTWHLVWRRNKALSPVARAYLEFLENEKETIIRRSFAWVSGLNP